MVRGGLWRNRDFLKLWSGETVAATGAHVTQLALPLLVLGAWGANAAEVGLVTATQYLPALCVTPFAGLVIDLFGRRLILLIANLVRAAALGVVPVLYFTDTLSVPALCVIAFLGGAGTSVFAATLTWARDHRTRKNGNDLVLGLRDPVQDSVAACAGVFCAPGNSPRGGAPYPEQGRLPRRTRRRRTAPARRTALRRPRRRPRLPGRKRRPLGRRTPLRNGQHGRPENHRTRGPGPGARRTSRHRTVPGRGVRHRRGVQRRGRPPRRRPPGPGRHRQRETPPPYFVEIGHVIPAELPAGAHEEIAGEVTRALRALELRNRAWSSAKSTHAPAATGSTC